MLLLLLLVAVAGGGSQILAVGERSQDDDRCDEHAEHW